MKIKILISTLILFILYSCGGSKSTTSMVDAKKVVATTSLEEGKSLYESNCAKCHKLYEPIEFSKEDWKPIVRRMQKKAHLSDEQGTSIYNYIASKS
ncbi:MAG: cytochrome c [Flavobacterium sp.]